MLCWAESKGRWIDKHVRANYAISAFENSFQSSRTDGRFPFFIGGPLTMCEYRGFMLVSCSGIFLPVGGKVRTKTQPLILNPNPNPDPKPQPKQVKTGHKCGCAALCIERGKFPICGRRCRSADRAKIFRSHKHPPKDPYSQIVNPTLPSSTSFTADMVLICVWYQVLFGSTVPGRGHTIYMIDHVFPG